MPPWLPLVAILALVYLWWVRAALFVFKKGKTPQEEEHRRTLGSAIGEISRVQGLGPILGSSADLGPPPPDPVDDDAHTFRMDAPPKPPGF